MTSTSPAVPETAGTPGALGPDDYQHVVGTWQARAHVWLRRMPRALCGQIMDLDMDRPTVRPDSPVCPACLTRSGGAPGQWTPQSTAWWR